MVLSPWSLIHPCWEEHRWLWFSATESLTCNESLSALSPHWQTGSSFYFFHVISWWGTITGIYLWSHLLWSLTCCLIISYGLRFQRHICLCLLFSSKKSHDLVSKLSHLVFLLVSSSQVEYFFLVSRKKSLVFCILNISPLRQFLPL